jgi:hypothetical protein
VIGERHNVASSGADACFQQLVLFPLIGDVGEKGEQAPERMRAFARA